jgi:dTDP-4-dehydrorhamnose reductase
MFMNHKFDGSFNILILGVSSWLGYELVASLNRSNFVGQITGTYHHTSVHLPNDIKQIFTNSKNDIVPLVDQLKPDVVVNFLRGETEADYVVHCQLHKRLREMQSHYVYASSILALDGYQDTNLTEGLQANAVSDYGKFKARCEQVFEPEDLNWCVLRFASVQGWVPHKRTRNEVFLTKLAMGYTIEVDQGVRQNRMLASLLTDGLVNILTKRFNGVFHFGTVDSSEEHVFLRRLASCFGYSPDLVVPGKERKVNLVAEPGRILLRLGQDYRVTEQDTLRSLSQLKGLQKYYSNGNLNT